MRGGFGSTAIFGSTGLETGDDCPESIKDY
jgi:hypothetical protein